MIQTIKQYRFNIFVQARYALGLNNHFTGSDIGDAKFTVSSFGLSVGYRF